MTAITSTHPQRTAPGPAGKPLVGNFGVFRNADPLVGFEALHRDYGDIVRLTIAGRPLHLLFGARAAKYVLVDNNKNYIKGRGLAQARPLLGNGLLTSEGEFWRRQRRLIQPVFNRRRIEDFAPDMAAVTLEVMDGWAEKAKTGEAVNIAAEMNRLALEVISRTMFATGLAAGEAERVSQAVTGLMHIIGKRIGRIVNISEKIPTPTNRRSRAYIAALDEVVYRMIAERRASGLQRDDLLGLLMGLREAGEAAMTDRQLRDEIMTIFLAGHETTAALLAWTWMLLSRNPAARTRLQDEVDAELGDSLPSAADLARLPYTRQVLDETLRLYPPGWVIGRQALAEDEIEGYPIPAGTGVLLVPYVMHRSTAYWDNPHGFDPERFDPEREKERPAYAYLPFSGGPRLCIGSQFALQEAAIALAVISRRWELNLAPGYAVRPSTDFTLRPDGGIWVHLQARD